MALAASDRSWPGTAPALCRVRDRATGESAPVEYSSSTGRSSDRSSNQYLPTGSESRRRRQSRKIRRSESSVQRHSTASSVRSIVFGVWRQVPLVPSIQQEVSSVIVQGRYPDSRSAVSGIRSPVSISSVRCLESAVGYLFDIRQYGC